MGWTKIPKSQPSHQHPKDHHSVTSPCTIIIKTITVIELVEIKSVLNTIITTTTTNVIILITVIKISNNNNSNIN